MKNRMTQEKTRIVYDTLVEELKCEACGKILHWNFGFKRCPYCHRRVTETQKRRAKVGGRCLGE